jgi:hypothetical protein
MSAPEPAPSFRSLIDGAIQLFNTAAKPSEAEATELRAIVDQLLDPQRGAKLDYSDPANSGLASAL